MSARVEWLDAGHPFGGVTLARRGQPWSADIDDAEPVTSEVAVVLSADDVVVLHGTATEARDLLQRALALVDDHQDDTARARATQSCSDDAPEHEWVLVEDGYQRSWHTTIDADGHVTASFNGSSDWTENGDGDEHLRCTRCPARRDVDHDQITWT